MVFVPGAGFVRMLVMGMRLDDLGFSSQLSSANARVGTLRNTMAGTAAGAGALRLQLAVLGIAATSAALAMTGAWAGFERTTALAAFAATNSTKDARAAMIGMRKEAVNLARDTNTPLKPVADLQKQIAQLGDMTVEQSGALSRAGAILAKFGDIQAARAAESLYRLVNITEGAGTPGFDRALKNSVGLASGLKKVADNSAAGVEGMIEFLRKLQVAGVTANFTAQELIGIAGAVTDVDEGVREKTTSSLIRLTAQVIPRATAEFAEFFRTFGQGIDSSTLALLSTEEGLSKVFAEKPIELIKGLVVASNNLDKAIHNNNITFGKGSEIRKKLGEDNIRDIQTIAILGGNYDKMTSFVKLANEEFGKGLIGEDQTAIVGQFNELLKTLSERITKLRVEFDIFMMRGGLGISNAIGGLIDGLTKLFRLINQNEKTAGIIAGLVTGVPLAIVGTGVARMGASLFRGGLLNTIVTGRVGGGGPLGLASSSGTLSQFEATRMALGAQHADSLAKLVGERNPVSGAFMHDASYLGSVLLHQRQTQRRATALAFEAARLEAAERSLNSTNFLKRLGRTPFGIGAVALNLRERFPVTAARFLNTGIGGRIGGMIGGLNAGALAGSSRLLTMGIPILNVLMTLGLLADVFGFLGRATADLRKQGGLLGGVFTALTIIFKGLEIVGLVVNKVFGLIWDGLKSILNVVGKFLNAIGLGGVVDFFANIGDNLVGLEDQIIGALRGQEGATLEATAPAAKQVNIKQENNITTTDQDHVYRIQRQATTDLLWRAGLRVTG